MSTKVTKKAHTHSPLASLLAMDLCLKIFIGHCATPIPSHQGFALMYLDPCVALVSGSAPYHLSLQESYSRRAFRIEEEAWRS